MVDVIVNPDIKGVLTKISAYIKGKWIFVSLGTPTYTVGNQQYYKISYPFGLLTSTESNPSNATVIGKVGDYVSKLEGDLELAYIPSSYYNKVIKPKGTTQPVPKVLNSKALQDPKFLDCIITNGASTTYNNSEKIKKSSGEIKTSKDSKDCNCG